MPAQAQDLLLASLLSVLSCLDCSGSGPLPDMMCSPAEGCACLQPLAGDWRQKLKTSQAALSPSPPQEEASPAAVPASCFWLPACRLVSIAWRVLDLCTARSAEASGGLSAHAAVLAQAGVLVGRAQPAMCVCRMVPRPRLPSLPEAARPTWRRSPRACQLGGEQCGTPSRKPPTTATPALACVLGTCARLLASRNPTLVCKPLRQPASGTSDMCSSMCCCWWPAPVAHAVSSCCDD